MTRPDPLVPSTPSLALALAIVASLSSGLAYAEAAAGEPLQGVATQCLLRKLAGAADSTTLGELRAVCSDEAASIALSLAPAATPEATAPPVMTQQLDAERDAASNLYTITAHHPNYFLLASYSSQRPSSATFADPGEADEQAQKVEGKFQISLKALLWENAFGGAGELFVGYTQRSFWQMYNGAASYPFRETDYEPEVWLRRVVNQPVLGWNLSTVELGANHQSNGRGDEYSRSWNRLMASVALERGDYGVVFRPWWRIPESDANDSNPDITDYLGSFDLTLIARHGEHAFDLMLRNNLQTHDNRGAIQLGWTYPLTPKIRAYVQLFSGYGESLIDYNVNQTSIGFGLRLLDW